MKKVVPIIIVAVVVIVGAVLYFVSKNNSTSNSGSSSQRASMSNQPEKSATANPQAADKVTIQGMAFNPAAITVKKGTTVTWTNEDPVSHTVTETDGQDGPNSATLSKGHTYTFTYDTAGTFKYHCSIHPDMTGTVTVTD